MNAPIEQASGASSDTLASVIPAWSQLESYLDRRSRELSEEVHNYPTPIARCDEQLTKLIEQRTRAINELKRLHQIHPTQSSPADPRDPWLAALEQFLAGPQAFPDDEAETDMRACLRAALSGLRHEE